MGTEDDAPREPLTLAVTIEPEDVPELAAMYAIRQVMDWLARSQAKRDIQKKLLELARSL